MERPDFTFSISSPPIIVCPDFETLSLESDAAIIGLGSAIFSPGGEIKPFINVFPISALGQWGRSVDPDTLNWWSVRPENGLRLCFQKAMAGEGPPLHLVLKKFLEDCATIGGEQGVWWLFKPSCFDGAIFRHACMWAGLGDLLEQVGLGASRRRMLDLQSMRFLAAWAGIEVPENVKSIVPHHPWRDAEAQARSGDVILTLARHAVSGAPAEPEPEPVAAAPVEEPTEPTESVDGADTEAEVVSARAVVINSRANIVALCDRFMRGEVPTESEPMYLSYIGKLAAQLVSHFGVNMVSASETILRDAAIAAKGERPEQFYVFLGSVKTMVEDDRCTPDVLHHASIAAGGR
jgi:hypothetical protein